MYTVVVVVVVVVVDQLKSLHFIINRFLFIKIEKTQYSCNLGISGIVRLCFV